MPNKRAAKKTAPRKRTASTRRSPTVVTPAPRLGPGGPHAGVVTRPPHDQKATHPLVQANPKQVHTILVEAFDGRPARLQDLYDDMNDRDERVGSVVRTRTLSIQARPWSVIPPRGLEDDGEAKRIAEATSVILGRVRSGSGIGGHGGGGWRTVIGEMADGILRGYSVSEIEWGVSNEGWHVPRRLHWRHPNRFAFDRDMRMRRLDRTDSYPGTDLEDFGPDKFVVHSPTAGRPAYPMRRGIMLGMVFPSLTKRYGLRWWLQATERWGSPLPIITLPANELSESLQTAAQRAINDITTTWSATLWGGMTVDTIGGEGKVDAELYGRLVDLANTSISIQGLGQNLSTEVTGGSYAAAKTHETVRMDLHAGDLSELDDTITWQLIEPIVRYNWPGAPIPEYVTEIEQREPIDLPDVEAGLFTDDEYRSSKGYSPKPDGQGSEYRKPVAVAVPGSFPVADTPGSNGIASPAATEPAATPPATPPRGADAEGPLAATRMATTLPTTERWTTGPAQELYRAWAGSASSPSRPSSKA
jgi:phage gp29-like protein